MVPDGYIIRRATKPDILKLAELAVLTKLAKSSPPTSFKPRRQRNWNDGNRVRVLVACPVDRPRLVVSMAEIQSLDTSIRSLAQLECVATHPDHEGRGLGRAILGRLFWYAQFVWEVDSIIWTSEDVEERVRARRFYFEVVEAGLIPGTNCNFRVRCPWQPPKKMQSHFVDHRL
jgi:GNAT superfamily N-acetyltransferase